MLRTKKDLNRNASQWCVILNPIESELSKAETIEKIVEIFPLSIEESSQLVERTPIILLENLTYEQAKKVKDLFGSVDADILLTDDDYQRRRCYRTIWPQDPLSKINSLTRGAKPQMPTVKPTSLAKEKLSKESAIHTIRKEETETPRPVAETTSVSETPSGEPQAKEKLEQEVRELKQQLYTLKRAQEAQPSGRGEFEYLSLELEQAKEHVRNKEREVEQLKEKIDSLTASQEPPAAGVPPQAVPELKQELALEESAQELITENKKLKNLLADIQRDNEELHTVQRSYAELKNKYEYLEHDVRDFAAQRSVYEDIEKKYATTQRKIKRYENEIQTLHDALSERTNELGHLRSEIKQAQANGLEAQKKLEGTVSTVTSDAQLKTETIGRLEGEKEKLRALLQDLQRDNERLRQAQVNYDALEDKYIELEQTLKQFAETKAKLAELEEQQRGLKATLSEKNVSVQEYKRSVELKDIELDTLKSDVTRKTTEQRRLEKQLRALEGEITLKDDSCRRLEEEKEQLRSMLAEVQQDNEGLHKAQVDYDELEKKFCDLEIQLQDHAKVKSELEILRHEHAELQSLSAHKDRQIAAEHAQMLKVQKEYSDFKKQYAELQATNDSFRTEKERLLREQDNLLTQQQKRIEELDRKCRRLLQVNDKQQKTIQELTVQREEREAVQKRIKLQQDITLKEAQLKELVTSQGSFEKEIIEREQRIKDILTRQEGIEKELVRLKQDQKHLIEKSKMREKGRIPKPSSKVSFESPPQAPPGDKAE